jgi:hypothetical protein
MKGKKEFQIPTNINETFEIFGIPWKPFVAAFTPFITAGGLITWYAPIGAEAKLLIGGLCLTIPLAATKIKGYKRENIAGYKLLKYHIDFFMRNRVYKYRKEGLNHEINKPITTEENNSRKAVHISSTKDSSKGYSFRLNHNKRKQSSKGFEGERSKYAANE